MRRDLLVKTGVSPSPLPGGALDLPAPVLPPAPALPRRDARYSLALIAAIAVILLAVLTMEIPLRLPVLALGLGALIFLACNHLWWRRPFFPYDRILSAVSEDGLVWQREPGIRLDVGGRHQSCQVYQPALAAMESGLRMYYRAGGYQAFIASAVSPDGWRWQEEEGERIGGMPEGLLRVESPEVIGVEPGLWRMYYAGFDGRGWSIYCRHSADMLNWKEERCLRELGGPELGLQTRDPAIIRSDGGYQLFFLRLSAAGESQLYTAFSADGLNWREVQPCCGYQEAELRVREPCVVRLGSGGMRLYFSEYPRTSVIGSRIASALSADGIQWQREPGIRLGPGGPFDRHGVFCPEVVPWKTGWRMYCGGYWGRHWLEPFTLLAHRRRHEPPNKRRT